MGHGSALARLQRQARLGPIESLNLALLVDGDDHGVSWRVHVETDDVLDLLGEFRIVGALEGAKPMRLQAIGLPQTLDGAQRDADRLGHGAAGPMRGFARRLGTGRRQHFRHLAGRKRRSAWLACLVTQEAVYPFLAVAPLPAPNGRAADSGSASDFGDRQTRAAETQSEKTIVPLANRHGSPRLSARCSMWHGLGAAGRPGRRRRRSAKLFVTSERGSPLPFPTCPYASGLRSGPRVSRTQLEAEREKACAEKGRIGADPPGHHQGAEHRRSDQHYSENNRNDPAQGQPPAAMVLGEIEGRAKLQRSRNEGPSREETDKDEHRETGHGHGENPRHDPGDALECKKSPTFALACRAHGGNTRQDSIDNQKDRKQADERQQRRTREKKRDQADDEPENAPRHNNRPVARKG